MRVGIGYDVHKLIKRRKLVLGGVKIPFEKGLLGHSDADALIHAIGDAILGAAGLGDIGRHFPDTDPKYRGVSSLKILSAIREKISGYEIANIDSTIVCERPMLAGYIGLMKENIGRALGIEKERVNVKATTEEGLGFTGSGEGIAAWAVALLQVRGIHAA